MTNTRDLVGIKARAAAIRVLEYGYATEDGRKLIAAVAQDVPSLCALYEASQAALADAIASNTANAAERDELKAIAQATRATLTVLDEWMGMASTREAAVDSMRRLGLMLERVDIKYTWQHILDWRGSIIDELWQARFYAGPDGHWHYAPGDPAPVFGNAVGPELALIVGRMENAQAERDALASVVTRQRSEIDTLRAENELLREHASQRLLDDLARR